MAEYRKYSIKKNRFHRSFLTGMIPEGEHTLQLDENVYRRVFISDAIDGVEKNAAWGRFRVNCDLSEDMVMTVYAVATNERSVWLNDEEFQHEEVLYDEETSLDLKKNFMEYAGALKAINQNDILLYELEGRYLYLMIEVIGLGKGSLSNIYVDNKGDFFMDTFPEVYREHNSFFHRYISVFSSLYLDFQDKVDGIASMLDIDTAPVELLPTFGRWMGLDISGDFLKEDRLRLLVKEAYQLNRIKGTKLALERLSEIILGEKAIILEKNVLRDDVQTKDVQFYEELYGKGTFDVTMLIHTFVPENQKSQLMFLLNQFKPVRSNLIIRFLDAKGNLDSHTYMDMNAYIEETESGALDHKQGMDGNIIILE
ncbi:MAG: phage tail protein [Bacillota bacterium]|nr:phage tail protein [Bacillota bacterium]